MPWTYRLAEHQEQIGYLCDQCLHPQFAHGSKVSVIYKNN